MISNIADVFSEYELYQEDDFLPELFFHVNRLRDFNFGESNGYFNATTNEIEFLSANVTLIVPPPYEYVLAFDTKDEEMPLVDSNLKKVSRFCFSDPEEDCFPLLFMSNEDLNVNQQKIDSILNSVILILNKKYSSVENLESLISFIND
jgi:hypothetical protein